MPRGKNDNHCLSEEKKVTCEKCHKKFTIKLGKKNNGYRVEVRCRYCRHIQFVANHA